MNGQTFLLKPWMVLEGGQGDNHLLIDNHSGVICACNDTAWILLGLLKDGATLGHLCQALCDDYDLNEVEARRDSLSFIHQLSALGCVDELD